MRCSSSASAGRQPMRALVEVVLDRTQGSNPASRQVRSAHEAAHASCRQGTTVPTRRSHMAATLTPSAVDGLVRPFQVEVREADLADMRARIAATRFPERETVDDDSQGVPLALMQNLA